MHLKNKNNLCSSPRECKNVDHADGSSFPARQSSLRFRLHNKQCCQHDGLACRQVTTVIRGFVWASAKHSDQQQLNW
jgi:hypothetical protein